jgi:hypothetical protein
MSIYVSLITLGSIPTVLEKLVEKLDGLLIDEKFFDTPFIQKISW